MASSSGVRGAEALRVEHVAKRFGGVTALRDVNLRLDRGEVLGLIGDNDAGRIFMGGGEVVLNELSVYHNMFLNRELVPWPLLGNRRMRRLAREHLEDLGVDIPSVDDEVAKLSDLVVAEYRAARTQKLRADPGMNARPTPRR